jgi:hypothetical protein
VPLDSVQEFRVTVAGQNADQGRSSGGQVTLITKSGTNTFRGSAYEYNRDTKFAVQHLLQRPSGIPKEQLKRNQYGASLGGRSCRTARSSSATSSARTDDSGANQLRRVSRRRRCAPAPSWPSAKRRQTYALGPDALKAIDPLGIGSAGDAAALQACRPNDTSAGARRGLNFAGYRFNAPLPLDNRAYVGKFDASSIAECHNLSVRFSVADAVRDDSNNLAQYPRPGSGGELLNNSYGISAQYTAIVSPTLRQHRQLRIDEHRASRAPARSRPRSRSTASTWRPTSRGPTRASPRPTTSSTT